MRADLAELRSCTRDSGTGIRFYPHLGKILPRARVGVPRTDSGRCERCERDEDPLCRSFGILGETCDGGLAELVAGKGLPRGRGLPAHIHASEVAVAADDSYSELG